MTYLFTKFDESKFSQCYAGFRPEESLDHPQTSRIPLSPSALGIHEDSPEVLDVSLRGTVADNEARDEGIA